MRAHQCPGHGRVHEDADDDDWVDDEPGRRGELHQPRPVPRAGHQLRPLPAQPRQQQSHHQHRLPASSGGETSYYSHVTCYQLCQLEQAVDGDEALVVQLGHGGVAGEPRPPL